MKIKFEDNILRNSICNLNTQTMIDKKINLSCIIEEYQNEINNINIPNNPDIQLITEYITLYFNNFKDLSIYEMKVGKILKNKCISNSYNFFCINTTINRPIAIPFSFNLKVSINNEVKLSKCNIFSDISLFNMSCLIIDYCPEDNIDIIVEKENYFFFIDGSSIYLDTSNDIDTTTLTAGYIKKVSCNKGKYSFTINNNIISGITSKTITGQFKLKLYQFENEVSCTINPNNKIISCTVTEENNEYCENICKDIKVEYLIDNYIINDNYILHLNGFDNLETFTIEAGDLHKGKCIDNIYEFTFVNSISYNDILNENEDEFKLKLSYPEVYNTSLSTRTKKFLRGKSWLYNLYLLLFRQSDASTAVNSALPACGMSRTRTSLTKTTAFMTCICGIIKDGWRLQEITDVTLSC